jgi:CheY-like chemotaxis protein
MLIPRPLRRPFRVSGGPLGESIIGVLIVEDSDAFAGFIKVVATGCGYEARILQFGERFEDVVSDWKPDIIVLDILMPERDGIELSDALAQARHGGQLILVSGAEEFYLMAAAKYARDRDLALSAALRKPCRAEELCHALRKAGASVLKQKGGEGE